MILRAFSPGLREDSMPPALARGCPLRKLSRPYGHSAWSIIICGDRRRLSLHINRQPLRRQGFTIADELRSSEPLHNLILRPQCGASRIRTRGKGRSLLADELAISKPLCSRVAGRRREMHGGLHEVASRPNSDQLKRQAKDLLADYRRSDPAALKRFRNALPAAAGLDYETGIAPSRCTVLHRSQNMAFRPGSISRASSRQAGRSPPIRPRWRRRSPAWSMPATSRAAWTAARPHAAARLISDHPSLAEQSPWIACAVGDVAAVWRQIEREPLWVNRPGGPLNLPPLVAATHSSLLCMADYKDRLHVTVDLLLDAGSDSNQSVGSRWPPASLDAPSQDQRLSALCGAAGQNHDPQLTSRPFAAGADPNYGESLYHSLEAPACTRLLLEAGAIVTGTNALFRALDFDDIDTFRLLLS